MQVWDQDLQYQTCWECAKLFISRRSQQTNCVECERKLEAEEQAEREADNNREEP